MLPLADVIDYQFSTIAANEPVGAAIAQLNQTVNGYLLVVAAEPIPCLVGVFTDREVVQLMAAKKELNGLTVLQVMQRSLPFLTLKDLEDIPSVLAFFRQQQASALPVVDEQACPIGWLTCQNLLQAVHANQSEKPDRFRPFFEQAAVGVAQISLNGQWLLVNQTLCDMLGYVVEELLSRPETEIIYARDGAATQMHYQSLLAGDAKTCYLEERFVCKDQSTIWVSTSTSLVHDTDNEPQYFIKIFKDISDHKRAETALRRQLNRALLLQKVTDSIRSQLDPQQVFEVTVTQVGQAFNADRCLLMTFKTDPLPQFLVAAEYVEPGNEPLAMRALFFKKNAYAAKVLSQDQAVVSANVYADRLLQPMESLCQQFGLKSMLTVRTSYQGKPNGAIALHQCDRFRDWTSSELRLLEEIAAQVGIALAQVRLLEQEKQQRQAIDQQNAILKQEIRKRKHFEVALSRSNASLQAQQEAAIDGILLINEYRYVTSFNRRFCEVWQIPLEWMHQTDSPQLLQRILVQLEHPQEFLNRVEYLYAHPTEVSHDEIFLKDGRILERYSAPVQSSTSEYYGRVWFFRDISERKQTEIRLEQRERYLAVLVEIQRHLLASNYTNPGYTDILQKLGQTCGADRVYLFENHRSATDDLLMNQRAEWCAPGIQPEIDNPMLQNLAYDEFPRWASVLATGESIQGIVADFPESERAILAAQGIQSLLVLPLMVNHQFWGFIGFDNCTESRQWTASEISLLSVAASAISLYQERQQAEAALWESIQRERATLRVVERMRQTLDLEQIFNATVEELRHLLKCDRVIVFQFNADWSGECTAESCGDEWVPIIQERVGICHLTEDLSNSDRCRLKTWRTVYSASTEDLQAGGSILPNGENRYSCINNVDTANLHPTYLSFLTQLQAKAYLIVPIYRGNTLWGLLASYQNSQPRVWDTSEINLVIYISTQLSIALQQAELLNQTQKQSADLEKAKDAAEAANRAKSEFLTNISHELRTPLNAILGFTQVMSHDVSKPKHQEYINIINRSGQHLLRLINDVLEMSKIEAGRHRLKPSSFDLHSLLDSLYEMLSLKAQAKGLILTFEIDLEVPQYITTDEGKLRQILLNLLGNAIKFTSSGRVILRVSKIDSIESEMGENSDISIQTSELIRLHFEVEDNGVGITPEEIPDLFTPFVQTLAGQQSLEGTGLGLAISQKFVQLMGGIIAVDSVPNQGSCFRFDSYVASARSPKNAIVPSTQRVISLEPEQPPYRILIVEDRWENRQLLVDLLHPIGFEVQVATNGEEGVRSWQIWHPHLILMDIRMPIMDGYEAIQRIKALAKDQPPIMIAITSNAFDKDRAAILAAGCNDFISKPFQKEIIFSKLSEHLGVRYVYENSEHPSYNHSATHDRNSQLFKNTLKEMSERWNVQLLEAAIRGRDASILELVLQIPEIHNEFARELEILTKNFQFEEIIDLISPASIDSLKPVDIDTQQTIDTNHKFNL